MAERSLRLARLLVVVGFFGVAFGTVVTLSLQRRGLHYPDINAIVVELSVPVGLACVGFAWWQVARSGSVVTIRRVSAACAVAAVAFSAMYWAELYGLVSSQDLIDREGGSLFPHYHLLAVSDISAAVGLLVAAVGLFLACRVPEPSAPASEVEAVGTPV